MPTPKQNESKQDFLKRCTSELIESEGREADQAFAMCNSYWDENNTSRPIMELCAPVTLAKTSADKTEKKQFLITAYTGKVFDTWFGKVIFDIAGMKTKKKMPILREHARDRIVGYGEAYKDDDNKNFFVKGEFSQRTEDAREVYELAAEGYPWQASVAVWARKIRILESDKESTVVNGQDINGPIEIWTESDVGETSFVTLGRDDNTAAITLAEKAERRPVVVESSEINLIDHSNETEDIIMSEEKKTELTLESLKNQAPELLAGIEDAAFQKGKSEGIAVERQRVTELLEAGADESETRKAIDAGIDAAEAYKQFYFSEKKKRAEGLKDMQEQATDPQGQESRQEEADNTPEKTPIQLRREWRPASGPTAQAK